MAIPSPKRLSSRSPAMRQKFLSTSSPCFSFSFFLRQASGLSLWQSLFSRSGYLAGNAARRAPPSVISTLGLPLGHPVHLYLESPDTIIHLVQAAELTNSRSCLLNLPRATTILSHSTSR